MRRHIRVFLSSTFRDMQAERETLIKRVFPGLRRRCRQRGIDLVEVDLRWGITEAQAERGEVIPLCIREIEDSRPYFVGILGGRYGWVPDALPDAPWALPGKSVTHMEINWAALRAEVRTDRSFFFFDRDAPGPAEQQALKAEIRARALAVEEYTDAADLGRRVERALAAALDADFPEATTTSWLDGERDAMAAFQASRTRVYVPRPQWFARLDAPDSVVITGPSGLGKSALVANWADRASGSTFVHFYGATPRSVPTERVIHRLLDALGAAVPDDPVQRRAAVAPALAAAAPLTVVLDAVDHAEDLSWLPHPLPEGVKLVATARPGPQLDELVRRGYPTEQIAPLSEGERRSVLQEVLARHGKALSAARVDRIVAAPQTASPLFLRTMTEELRVWGDHEGLDEVIDRMLAAADVPALFDRVLQRWEADYELERPGLVGAVLSSIAAARRGLSEPELLAVLDVAPLVWAPLHHAIEPLLMNRVGALAFFHDGLREAVERRYLSTDDARRARRSKLVEYFTAQSVDDRVAEELPWLQAEIGDHDGLARTLTSLDLLVYWDDEAELRDLTQWWSRLTLDPAEAYPAALDAYAGRGPAPLDHAILRHAVARFLRRLARWPQALAQFDRARHLYEEALPADDPTLGVVANDHALALYLSGRYREAEPLFRKAVAVSGELAGTLHNLAEILLRRNAPVEAEGFAQRAVDAFREVFGRHELTATAMQNLARARMEQGDFDGADALLTESLSMVEGAPTEGLALALSNLGNLRMRQHRMEEAEGILRRSVEVSRTVLGPDHPHAASTISMLAGALYFLGRTDEAEAAYRESIQLMEEHLGPEHPNLSQSLTALANIQILRGEASEASAAARRVLAMAERELGTRSVEAGHAHLTLSACAAHEGDYDEASRLALRACALHTELLGAEHETTERTCAMIDHLGRQLLEGGDPARAEPLLRSALQRAEGRWGFDAPEVGPALWNLARALVVLERPAEAVPLLERELALLEAHRSPDDDEVAASRRNLAEVRAALD